MGTILSSIESIEQLQFVELKAGQPVDVEKALRLGNGITLLKLKGGKWATVGGTSLGRIGNSAYLGFGAAEPSRSVMYGLAQMGAITKKEATAHVKQVKANNDVRQRKYQMKRLQSLCCDLGLPLPDGVKADEIV